MGILNPKSIQEAQNGQLRAEPGSEPYEFHVRLKLSLECKEKKNLFVRRSGQFISLRHYGNRTCHTSHYQQNQYNLKQQSLFEKTIIFQLVTKFQRF
jgi:hypothetical protein